MTNCAFIADLNIGVPEEAFDCESFLARVDDDTQLACELIELFLDDYPEKMVTIENAIRAGDAAQLRLAAHALRGTVGNFNARPAQELSHRLEQMGRSGELMGAPAVYPDLVAAISRLRSALIGLTARLAA